MFIISDTHFNHANIIKYCGRPFANFDVMNEEMVRRWNSVVGPKDVILHLGDVGFYYDNTFKLVNKLNGHKLLVLGNHDESQAKMERMGFEVICAGRHDHTTINWKGREILLTHRPKDLPEWKPEDKRVRLCGHEHNSMPIFIRWIRDKQDNAIPICALNMSVEHHDYTPLHIDKCIEMWDGFMKEIVS